MTPAKTSSDNRNLTKSAGDPAIHLQQMSGNQNVPRLTHSSARFDFVKIGIQPKLKVSQPGDVYEQEADRVAEQVMRMPTPDPIHPVVLTKEEKVNLKISTRPVSGSALETKDNVMAEINNICSGSDTSLDANTKEFMEARFGYDFSSVRVHTDERAARSANSVNALAYTVGNDIVFGQRQFSPHTFEGMTLLAHELSHVIQQRGLESSIQRQSFADPTQEDLAEFEEDKRRFEEARRSQQEALKRGQTVKELQEAQKRNPIPSRPNDALAKAGIKSPERTVHQDAAGLMDVALRQSNLLGPYLRRNITIAGKKFIINSSDEEFRYHYRTLNDIKPGSDEWNVSDDIRGFYDLHTDSIHLRPTSNYGNALHEAIHKFSAPNFRHLFGAFLDEGVTQYFTNIVLKEQGLPAAKTSYEPNLECANNLFLVADFDLVARSFFQPDKDLFDFLSRRVGVPSYEDRTKLSEEWCRRLQKERSAQKPFGSILM